MDDVRNCLQGNCQEDHDQAENNLHANDAEDDRLVDISQACALNTIAAPSWTMLQPASPLLLGQRCSLHRRRPS
jgi:hypothetical protein